MVKYYDTIKKELTRDYANEVPLEILNKRNHIIYEEIFIDIEDTETLPENTFEILENKVISTKYKHIHIPTLEEYKEQKYSQIKGEGSMFILDKYSQLQQTSALAGFYPLGENEEIILFCKTNFDKIRALGVQIRVSTTKEEIDTFIWVD